MKKLVNKENMKVYVALESTWRAPMLFMSHNNKNKIITADSGELETPFGEFMLDIRTLVDEDLKKALEIVDEIADTNSIETLESIGMKRFTLNEKYMDKLKKLDKEVWPNLQ